MIFFDLDDTLFDSELAHKTAIKKIISNYSLKVDPAQVIPEWLRITDKYLKQFFDKKITTIQQRAIRIKELWALAGQQIADDQALRVYAEFHQNFLQSCSPFPETIPFLEKIKNHKLGIITNGPVIDQMNKLKNNGLIHYFDPIIISEEVGFAKPHKEIFNVASKRSDERISECIHVGDSFELDYLGATNAGMKAIWLDRKNSQNNPDSNPVHSLHELNTRLNLC